MVADKNHSIGKEMVHSAENREIEVIKLSWDTQGEKKLFVILRQIAAALGWTIKDVDWWCKVSVDGIAVAARVQLFVVL